MEIKREDKEKLILAVQAAVGVVYIALALKESVRGKSPQMKKVLAKQAKRLDKLNRMEYQQEKKAIKRRGKLEAAAAKKAGIGDRFSAKGVSRMFSGLRQKI